MRTISPSLTIHNYALCELTGLTDRRHRQLAKEGNYPEPILGEYKFKETLRGLFKYYQGKSEGATGLNKEEQAEKTKQERIKIQMENEEKLNRIVDCDYLLKLMEPACTAIKQKILMSSMTEKEKEEIQEFIFDLLKKIPEKKEQP